MSVLYFVARVFLHFWQTFEINNCFRAGYKFLVNILIKDSQNKSDNGDVELTSFMVIDM